MPGSQPVSIQALHMQTQSGPQSRGTYNGKSAVASTGCLPAKIMCQGAGSNSTERIGIPLRLLLVSDLHTGGIHDVGKGDRLGT